MNDSGNDENIIRADYIYLVIIGCPDIISKIMPALNKNINKNMYVATPIATPCAELIGTQLDKDLIFDEGIETAQCLIYAEEYENYSMIMEVTSESKFTKISFPIIQIDDKTTPAGLVETWIVSHIPNFDVDVTIRALSVVGNKHDILVFIAIVDKIIEI